MLQLWLAVSGVESTALTVNESGPAVLATPVIAPVEVFRKRPAGSDPVIEYV
jgi:hypothetical protein